MKDDFSIKGDVISALEEVIDPAKEKNLIDAHMVESVEVNAGVVDMIIMIEKGRTREDRFALEDQIADAVEAIDGVREAKVKLMTERGLEKDRAGESAPAEKATGAAEQSTTSVPASAPIEGVGRVIAIASGKGGVGKSTVAVNLALALKAQGHRVGLLDIDIYGPSVPTLLGVNGKPQVSDRRIVPLSAQGLSLMSLGFLLEDDMPGIWRGPIVTGIIRQFLRDVDWSGIDYLIIDMPPGTGDAQLALAQTVPVDGAVVVSTPSDLALIDAARGLQMFNTLNIDVLGIVENMSVFVCPSCGHESHIFGKDTVDAEAKRLGTEVLGHIPLEMAVRKGGDEGKPVVAADPDAPVSKAFFAIATQLTERLPLGKSTDKSATKKGLFSFLKG